MTPQRSTPSTRPSDHDIELAAFLVREAGSMALKMRNEGLKTEFKTSRVDVVSAADRAAEEWVVGQLSAESSEDSILGEEGAAHTGTSTRRWVIDPVDGTYNFLRGFPLWCSAIALEDQHGGVLLGAVFQPETNSLWVGGPGIGTRLNGEELPALEDSTLETSVLATSIYPKRMAADSERDPRLNVVERVAMTRNLGSASIEFASVASGRLDLYLQRIMKPWDFLPGQALVQGVGGFADSVTVATGDWHIAGNAAAVGEARTILDGK